MRTTPDVTAVPNEWLLPWMKDREWFKGMEAIIHEKDPTNLVADKDGWVHRWVLTKGNKVETNIMVNRIASAVEAYKALEAVGEGESHP